MCRDISWYHCGTSCACSIAFEDWMTFHKYDRRILKDQIHIEEEEVFLFPSSLEHLPPLGSLSHGHHWSAQVEHLVECHTEKMNIKNLNKVDMHFQCWCILLIFNTFRSLTRCWSIWILICSEGTFSRSSSSLDDEVDFFLWGDLTCLFELIWAAGDTGPYSSWCCGENTLIISVFTLGSANWGIMLFSSLIWG